LTSLLFATLDELYIFHPIFRKYDERSKIGTVSCETSPLQILPSALLLEDFHPGLSLDLFDFLCCLFFGPFHDVFLVAVAIPAATSSTTDIGLVIFLSFPTRIFAIVGRSIIDEAAL
jgi:hypothetical protein